MNDPAAAKAVRRERLSRIIESMQRNLAYNVEQNSRLERETLDVPADLDLRPHRPEPEETA